MTLGITNISKNLSIIVDFFDTLYVQWDQIIKVLTFATQALRTFEYKIIRIYTWKYEYIYFHTWM